MNADDVFVVVVVYSVIYSTHGVVKNVTLDDSNNDGNYQWGNTASTSTDWGNDKLVGAASRGETAGWGRGRIGGGALSAPTR